VSVTDWSDEFLDSLRRQADPAADAVVAGLFAGTADATTAFRALVVLQHNEVSDPDMATFLQAKDELPTGSSRTWWPPARSGSHDRSCLARAGSTSPRMVAPGVFDAHTANAHHVASSPVPALRSCTAN
jgi:hypothetical protein